MSASAALPVVVLGGGGHARVLMDALCLCGVTIQGYSDPRQAPGARGPFGAASLGGDEAVEALGPERVRLVNGIGSTRDTALRRDAFARFAALGFRFATIVHPAAIVAPDVELGEGAQVMAGAVLQTGSRIGADAIVNTRASIDHDCRIGAHAHIAPGAVLSGGGVVGEGSHVGTAATIIQSITIGERCTIGAGAVVTEDLGDCAIAVSPGLRARGPEVEGKTQ